MCQNAPLVTVLVMHIIIESSSEKAEENVFGW